MCTHNIVCVCVVHMPFMLKEMINFRWCTWWVAK